MSANALTSADLTTLLAMLDLPPPEADRAPDDAPRAEPTTAAEPSQGHSGQTSAGPPTHHRLRTTGPDQTGGDPAPLDNRGEQMLNGTVKWFSGAKGFGFITPAEGGGDLFFHHSQIEGAQSSIVDNQAVRYDLGEGRKGPHAIGVRAA